MLNKIVLIAMFFVTSCLGNQVGIASWYSVKSNGGTKTASGIPFCNSKYTCAHRTFPLKSKVRVTHLKTGKSITLVVTDRGPFVKGRIIDVSPVVADALEFKGNGITKVKVERID